MSDDETAMIALLPETKSKEKYDIIDLEEERMRKRAPPFLALWTFTDNL